MIQSQARIFHRAVLICYDRIHREVMEHENYDAELLDHSLYTYGVVSEKIDPDLRYWPES